MGSSTKVSLHIPPDKHLIFFDGYCSLCNSSIDLVIKNDPEGKFVCESLQSRWAKEIVPPALSDSIEHIVLRTKEGEILTKSEAVFFITKRLKGPVRLVRIFSFLPRILADFFYDLIAKNRYKLFGKRNRCRVPTEQEKLRFLEGYQKP